MKIELLTYFFIFQMELDKLYSCAEKYRNLRVEYTKNSDYSKELDDSLIDFDFVQEANRLHKKKDNSYYSMNYPDPEWKTDNIDLNFKKIVELCIADIRDFFGYKINDKIERPDVYHDISGSSACCSDYFLTLKCSKNNFIFDIDCCDDCDWKSGYMLIVKNIKNIITNEMFNWSYCLSDYDTTDTQSNYFMSTFELLLISNDYNDFFDKRYGIFIKLVKRLNKKYDYADYIIHRFDRIGEPNIELNYHATLSFKLIVKINKTYIGLIPYMGKLWLVFYLKNQEQYNKEFYEFDHETFLQPDFDMFKFEHLHASNKFMIDNWTDETLDDNINKLDKLFNVVIYGLPKSLDNDNQLITNKLVLTWLLKLRNNNNNNIGTLFEFDDDEIYKSFISDHYLNYEIILSPEDINLSIPYKCKFIEKNSYPLDFYKFEFGCDQTGAYIDMFVLFKNIDQLRDSLITGIDCTQENIGRYYNDLNSIFQKIEEFLDHLKQFVPQNENETIYLKN